MAKRKLSRQQAWRVEKIQEERARRAARRDSEAEQALAGGELGPEQEGIVVAHYGTQVAVASTPAFSSAFTSPSSRPRRFSGLSGTPMTSMLLNGPLLST